MTIYADKDRKPYVFFITLIFLADISQNHKTSPFSLKPVSMPKVIEIKSQHDGDMSARIDGDDPQFEDLLRRCREGSPEPPWDEFFCLFNRLIIKTIHKTLTRYDKGFSQDDYDPVNEVYLSFVEKIIEDRLLDNITHPAALPSWIRTTVQNITIDWLRKQNARKNVFTNHETQNTLSLDEPVGASGELRLEDIIGGEDMTSRWLKMEQTDRLNDVLTDIETLEEEDLLILKAFCLFYEPFTDQDIQVIAERRNTTIESIEEEIDRLMGCLVSKNEKRVKKLDNEVIQWFMIRRMENSLSDMRNDPFSDLEEMADSFADIESKTEKLERSRKRGKAMIRPGNLQIARLLGIAEERAKQLSLKMMRIRKKLRGLMEARLQSEPTNT